MVFNNRLFVSTLFLSFLLANVQCTKKQNIYVFSSSQDGDRITRQTDILFVSKLKSKAVESIVDENIRFQKIDGFGATFNEAGMICLNSLLPDAKENVLKMLFDSVSGAGYTLMKSPIAACDFASAGPWYTYNDNPGDTSMSKFTIERDLGPNGLITFIRSAAKYGKFEIESPMDFAPDWMYFAIKKDEKHIRPEYYGALAKYYSKYLKAYK